MGATLLAMQGGAYGLNRVDLDRFTQWPATNYRKTSYTPDNDNRLTREEDMEPSW